MSDDLVKRLRDNTRTYDDKISDRLDAADLIEELEHKLFKAMGALNEISQESMSEEGCYYTNRVNIKRASAAIAKLKASQND